MPERDLWKLDFQRHGPFGPPSTTTGGRMLRGVQWMLTILGVMCAFPAVMLVMTTMVILLDGGFPPAVGDLLTVASWLAWVASVALTLMRVSGKWWRWWEFALAALSYAGALLALNLVPMLAENPETFISTRELLSRGDGLSDPVGQAIRQLMLVIVALQVTLHALWSGLARLEARKSAGMETEE